MKLTVKVLQGEECIVNVPESATVRDVKQHISKELNVSELQQKLIFMGKPLTDSKSLCEYHIKDGSKLNLVLKKADGSVVAKEEVTVLWDVLHRFLKNYYNENDTRKILEQFRKEFQKSISSLSLDDLERLAASYMQEQK